jgi:hypothetical protein
MNNEQLGSGRDVGDSDDDLDDDVDDGDFDETVVMDTDDDTLIGTAELNVDELVAKIEASTDLDVERKRQIKRRLEQLAEERDLDLDSTYNFNLNDDDS